MAAASPFDGRPSDPPPDSGPTSFVRSIRPPTPGLEERFLILLHAVVRMFVRTVVFGHAFVWTPCRNLFVWAWKYAKRIFLSMIAGGLGLAVYALFAPHTADTLKFSLPDAIEIPVLCGIFLAGAVLVWRSFSPRKG